MAKLILIAIAFWLVITILKRYRKNLNRADHASTGPQRHGETMVQCKYCGIHLPASESTQTHGQYFCCQAHARMPQDDVQD